MIRPNPISSALLRFASPLRFPQLFFLVAALFLADLAVPDLIPFGDEILLGLLTLLLGGLRKKSPPDAPPGEARK